jgi:signal transduction histidine kinase
MGSDPSPQWNEVTRIIGAVQRRLLDGLVAAAATGAELWLLAGDGQASARAIAFTVAAGGALALRRAYPLPVLGVALAGAVAIAAGGETPGGVAVLVALFTVASSYERRVSLAALAPAAIVVTGVSVAAADGGSGSVLAGALAAPPLTAGVWALGAYARARREAEARDREQLARLAVHEERAAIARELHDIVAHSVTVMLVGVRGARDVLRSSPGAADDTLARVEASGEQSLAELRRVLALLRRPERAAESRPQPSLAEVGELVAGYRAAGLPVRLEVIGDPRPLDDGVEVSVYRIVEEALTNVLKHARPEAVAVTLAFRGGRLEVEIVDDGPPGAAGAGAGHGVLGMRERVALLGGELETGPRDGGGFRVAARLPVAP